MKKNNSLFSELQNN